MLEENNKNININNDHLFKELNSVCSYLAMFPLHVPEMYIKKYTNEGDIVYDPFSGRGTTSLAAIKHNRIAYSNDLSSLAYVLTKSKNFELKKTQLIKRVKKLEKEFNLWLKDNFKNKEDKIFENMNVFYSEKNLNQLLFLREKIGINYKKISKVDNFILSISLGIMHGQTKVDGTSSYFSVSMPNGYSISPNYAKKYIIKENLLLIESNIFEQIINRINRKINDFIPKEKNKVFNKNALKSATFIKEKPDLIFTSPPYLNIVKYVSQNWIRFWLLGMEKKDTNKNIVDDFHKIDSYKIFMINFLLEMEKIMKKETKFLLVIGDVKQFKIREIMTELLIETNLKQIRIPKEQEIKRKLSSQMGNRKGKATPRDWVFELQLK